ncbi:MAG TPA: 16S rRNA (uracil(1498)-N(3))-methyltransferase [Pyrinomonadaceae bacterium]|jgi:16S rRNA (uracil1498-N3)-methyltransferase|nr:16S rRNA (uracil(1498)-N(3))-methyltransferase [Pyrinomonadaceae bacterium]
MTRRRFYAPPEAFAPDGARVVLSAEESRHLRDVLRLRAGDEAQVFDGEGREFACIVVESIGRAAALEVRGRAEPPSRESPLELTLAVALLKGEKFDLVVQKATELGASRVVPVATKRADVRLRDARDTARRVERWRRLALEASKQSGRARVPAVTEPLALDSFVEGAAHAGEVRLLFAERGGAGMDSLSAPDSLSIKAGRGSVSNESEPRPALTALVGPEGGWDDAEIARAREHGWTIITLGGRTLRAETAAIVVAAILQHRFGDLR